MIVTNGFENNDNATSKEGDLVKFWIEKVRKNLPLLIFSVAFALLVAFVVNKISPTVYQVHNSVILKNSDNKILDLQMLSSLAQIESQNLIHNETELLKSAKLIKRALRKLDFKIAYYENNSFHRLNIYHEAPFTVIPLDSSVENSSDFINITIFDSHQFKIWNKEHKEQRFYIFGAPITLAGFNFKVVLNTASITKKDFSFRFRSEQELYATFRNISINATPSSTVLNLALKGENPREIATFLNTLCNEYLIKSVEKKEFISDKTIDFIETQINDFSDSLHLSGVKLIGFKSSHQIMDFDKHSESLFNNLAELQKQKVALIAQLKYFEYLKEYLNDSKNNDKDIITPAVWGIDNVVLNQLISNLIIQAQEKSELEQVTIKENPLTIANNAKINELKNQIIENINGLIDINNNSLKNIEQSISGLSKDASKLPQTQLELFNYERMFKIYDALYTYLLTKRCEIQMTKAALTPDNEVMDFADYKEAEIISPRISKNYFMAIFLGLAIPLFIMFLSNYLSDKIRNADDLEYFNYPVLGHILHGNTKDVIPVHTVPASILSESFRSIRTHFQFVTDNKKKQVVLVTSSMKDEGKSFVTLNLAASFAISGKKCLMIFFDMRKTFRNKMFEKQNTIGLSNILCGNCLAEEAIQNTEIENLSVILPGVLPPNPGELITSEYCDEMILKLKEKYDYIFIDTPPLGLFTDALMLLKYTTINLYLVRYAYTKKGVLKKILNNLQQKNITKLHLILNDLSFKQSNYGYGYGYKYSYSYDAENRNSFRKLWKNVASYTRN